MPRTARASVGGVCYHVMNRGNARMEVFHDEDDYDDFVQLVGKACRRVPMRLLGCCVMPNHFHLVLRPRDDGDLGRWMQWLLTSHVRRHHRRHDSSGHLWQGRFKAFPIEHRGANAAERAFGTVQHVDPLWVVLRYVERNPVRAGLARRAEQWPWSSLRWWLDAGEKAAQDPAVGLDSRRAVVAKAPAGGCPLVLAMERPVGWLELVNDPQTDAELASVRRSVERGRPFGSDNWVKRMAESLGLESSLRPRGRPKKCDKK